MAKDTSKQRLANLIQGYNAVVIAAQSLYDDDAVKDWAITQSLEAQSKRDEAKKNLT